MRQLDERVASAGPRGPSSHRLTGMQKSRQVLFTGDRILVAETDEIAAVAPLEKQVGKERRCVPVHAADAAQEHAYRSRKLAGMRRRDFLQVYARADHPESDATQR